jgi:hypothetical protein
MPAFDPCPPSSTRASTPIRKKVVGLLKTDSRELVRVARDGEDDVFVNPRFVVYAEAYDR